LISSACSNRYHRLVYRFTHDLRTSVAEAGSTRRIIVLWPL
jgi:hypothetical protein